MITRVFLRSLQYGIVVLGFLDALVYPHHKLRLDSENSGNFGDFIKRKDSFNNGHHSYAHAHQATCLAQHFPGVQHHNFWLPKPKSRYPYLPDDSSITREKEATIVVCGLFVLMVVFASLMVKTLAGWCVISRSPRGRIDVMFGPVITTEAHLAFSGARIHSNNAAEMTAVIEALSFLGPHGPLTRDEQSSIYYDFMHAAGICLGTIRAHSCAVCTCVSTIPNPCPT